MEILELILRSLIGYDPQRREAVVRRLDAMSRDGRPYEDLTRQEFANLVEALNVPDQRKVTQERLGEPTARENVTRDLICECCEPEIKFLRWQLLGRGTPLSATEAYQWADTRFHQQWKKAWEGQAKELGMFSCFTSRKRKSMPIPIMPGDRELDVLSRGQWDEETMSYIGGVRRLVEHTGFEEAETVWWILTGKLPTLPRYRLQEHVSYLTGHGWITLEIHSADVTWRELWKLYHNDLRPFTNLKRQKVKPLHYRIYQLVDKAGGVPLKRKTVFWEGIRQKLEREKKWNKVPQWQGIRSAYNRFSDIHKAGLTT